MRHPSVHRNCNQKHALQNQAHKEKLFFVIRTGDATISHPQIQGNETLPKYASTHFAQIGRDGESKKQEFG